MADWILRAFTPVTARIGDHLECTCTPDDVHTGDPADSRYAGELHQTDCSITRTLTVAHPETKP